MKLYKNSTKSLDAWNDAVIPSNGWTILYSYISILITRFHLVNEIDFEMIRRIRFVYKLMTTAKKM